MDLGSAIIIEIQYGFNISIWPSLNPRFLPLVPCSLRSCILDPPYSVHRRAPELAYVAYSIMSK